ncbi:MAG TPA: hypothetical protein VGN00_20470 [Puia sp.]
MKNTLPTRLLFWITLSLYFVFIGYQALTSDYLFTDEAFMFWHQPDHHLTFKIWVSIGRILSGWVKDWMFGVSRTVADIKYIRFCTVLQCFLATLSLSYVLRRLQKSGLVFSDWLVYCAVAFFAASLSSLVLIGWAVCSDFFIPIILSLFAGLLLYESLVKGGSPLGGWLAMLMGIASLFIYQTMYPFILLPFYGIFLLRRDGRLTRSMLAALCFFFVVLGLYFLLFQWSLKATGVSSASRTNLGFDPLNRLSFFFSFPLNQAFNINAFFFPRSVLSQAIMPVLLLAWVLYTFFTRRGQAMTNIRYLAGLFVWWMLGYLPQLIARESFGPYRTMIVFSVMVFLMIGDVVFTLVKEERSRRILTAVVVLVLLIRGGYVYKNYIADPLAYEYKVLRGNIRDHYTAGTREVVFILAKEDGFQSSFGVGPQKDELGMPSTYKDWAPEGLVKQIVTEMTGSRAVAEALKVDVVPGLAAVSDPSLLKDPKVLVIDMPALMRQTPR